MVISDNGASAEGGPTGSVNENKFFNNVPDDLKQNLAAIDELGGPKYFNHYAWGWTFAGNTPFRRWKRETYRGGVSDPFIVHWPKGIKAKGEIRTQYRARHRHGADGARGAGHRAADADPRRHPVADRGRQLRAHLRRRRTRRPSTITQYFEMFAPPLASITMAGARCARGPGRRSRKPGVTSALTLDRGQAERARCQGLGALQRRRRLRPRPTTSPRRNAPS